MFKTKILSMLLGICIILTLIIVVDSTKIDAQTSKEVPIEKNIVQKVKKPKYVFYFIGDGNSLTQISTAENYLGTLKGNIGAERFAFTQFEAQGIATTYSADSFITDSAAAGTALASGYKTNSGMIGITPDGTLTKSIATLAKEKGMKVGIVTTTTINHATPAAFYSNNESRSNYYEIGKDLVESNFDYFAGGEITKHSKGQDDIYNIAENAGYKIIKAKEEFMILNNNNNNKILATGEVLQNGTVPYSIDSKENTLTLSELTKKGIELLENDNGFFMMVEGGKIDWACHANDAATMIHEIISFNEAINQAINFYKKHPEDTLIVVTADHETGGITMGFAGTKYSNFYEVLFKQKNSYEEFSNIIKEYVKLNKKNTKFHEVMKLVEEYFGLKTTGSDDDLMVLDDYEIGRLREAFKESITEEKLRNRDYDYMLNYNSYDPFTVTVTHILNQKAGISWTSYSHTGVPVPIYAQGIQSEEFNGYYDNTEIAKKLINIMGIKQDEF